MTDTIQLKPDITPKIQAEVKEAVRKWTQRIFEYDGRPDGTCTDCPLLATQPDAETLSLCDRSEAHYHCGLFDKQVWGESPECTWEQWTAIAFGFPIVQDAQR